MESWKRLSKQQLQIQSAEKLLMIIRPYDLWKSADINKWLKEIGENTANRMLAKLSIEMYKGLVARVYL